MVVLKSVGRKIMDLLSAAAFAEEGEADSALRLVREQNVPQTEKDRLTVSQLRRGASQRRSMLRRDR